MATAEEFFLWSVAISFFFFCTTAFLFFFVIVCIKFYAIIRLTYINNCAFSLTL